MLHFKLRKMFFHFKKFQLFEIKLFLHLLLTYFLDVGFCIVDKCCVNEDIFQFRGRVETYKRGKKEIRKYSSDKTFGSSNYNFNILKK